MLGDHTREELQYKLTKIEADRELFGWTKTHPTVHVITISGRRLRYQQQAVPAGAALGDLPHEQIEAYVHAPNTGNPLAVPGQPIAVSYTSELCGSCVLSLWPRSSTAAAITVGISQSCVCWSPWTSAASGI